MRFLKGKIQYEIYSTGTWETHIKGEIYHGAFQFVIDVKDKEMKGKWVGSNSKRQVGTGNWEWVLLSDCVDSTTKRCLVAEFHDN